MTAPHAVLPPVLPPVLLITDRHQLPPRADLVDVVGRCLDVGLTTVVLRELDLSLEERGELAGRLADRGAAVIGARTPLPRTAGVHLAAHQPHDAAPADRLHGRSCHTEEEVRRAVAAGASYLTVSPVAPTASKPGYGPALGPSGVRRLVAAAGEVPVYALGGVTPGNAAGFRAAGAHGVAVMGAVMRAADPAATCRALLGAVS